MIIPAPRPDGSASVLIAREVNVASDRFEGAWKTASVAGGSLPPPRIEDHLQAASADCRQALLVELVLLDVFYRNRQGESVSSEDYVSRFPGLAGDLVSAALAGDTPQGLAWDATSSFSGSGKAPAAAPVSGETVGTRYRVLREIGRGGMGAVLLAEDEDLNRTLALKVMLRPGDATAESRFLEEARVTGQLQHPGVPPVHEIGRLRDGRHFFSMKLIEGRTLAALLGERSSPGESLPRLLKIFEQVAQTIAYAHARRIIHRDLKPANVMVGAFGEVQVMDWGLARRMACPGVSTLEESARTKADIVGSPPTGDTASPAITLDLGAAENGVEEPAESDRLTGVGQILGTPAYMAPEQARGEGESLDQRTDVFGLGAILCEILTGRPPYGAAKVREILARAQRGDLQEAAARLRECGADGDLVSLALACLEGDAAKRPSDAAVVAQRMGEYFSSVQERLKAVEMAQAAALAKAAEERKRRRAIAMLSVAVVLMLTSAVGATTWMLQRRASTEYAVESALTEVAAAQVTRNWTTARAALQRAQGRLSDGGTAELRERVDQVQEDLEFVERLREIQMLRSQLGKVTDSYRETDAAYADEFRNFGVDLEKMSPHEAAARLKARSIPAEFAAALDAWAAVRRSNLKMEESSWRPLVDTASLADPDETRNQWRSALVRGDLAELRDLAKSADPAMLSPITLAVASDYLQDAGDPDLHLEFLRKSQRHYPGDAWLNSLLGSQLFATNRAFQPNIYAEAAQFYSAAVALEPSSKYAWRMLASCQHYSGQFEAALQSVERLKTLSSENEDVAAIHDLLSSIWHYQKDVTRAVAEGRQAIAIMPDHGAYHHNLAVALIRAEDYQGALAAFQASLAMCDADEVRAKADDLAGIGDVQFRLGNADAAVESLREAVRLAPDAASVHNIMAQVLVQLKRPDEALPHIRRAIEFNPALWEYHAVLGRTAGELNMTEEAVDAFRQALRLNPLEGGLYADLSGTFGRAGRPEEAAAVARQGIQFDPDLGVLHNELGVALTQMNRLAESLPSYEQAVQFSPENAIYHMNLAICLRALNRLEESLRAHEASIQAGKDLPSQQRAKLLMQKGMTHVARQELDAAVECFQKALELQPLYAECVDNLGVVLCMQREYQAGIARFLEALQLKPDLPLVRMHLATSFHDSGDREAALQWCREWVRFQPRDPGAHGLLGRLLINSGQLAEGIEACRQALELAPLFARPRVDLGRALAGQGRFVESLAELEFVRDLSAQFAPAPLVSDATLQTAQRNVQLEALLPYVQRDDLRPAAVERIEFGRIAKLKRLYATAARQYETAFAEEAALKEDVNHVYDAACYAALAGCGQGEDAKELSATENKHFRQLALAWMKFATAACAERLHKSDEREQSRFAASLNHWLVDPDLAGVRDPARLTELPSDEQQGWRALWLEVHALRARAQSEPEPLDAP